MFDLSNFIAGIKDETTDRARIELPKPDQKMADTVQTKEPLIRSGRVYDDPDYIPSDDMATWSYTKNGQEYYRGTLIPPLGCELTEPITKPHIKKEPESDEAILEAIEVALSTPENKPRPEPSIPFTIVTTPEKISIVGCYANLEEEIAELANGYLLWKKTKEAPNSQLVDSWMEFKKKYPEIPREEIEQRIRNIIND
jgi:hypothetical protein